MPRLLVVEDDPDIRGLLELRLRRLGHLVVGAGSGEEALTVLAEKGVPDLAVLDVLMPGMTGLELLGLLRQDPAYASMPAIFLSGRVQPGDVQAGRALGATYLTKPVVLTALTQAIDRALRPADDDAAAGSW